VWEPLNSHANFATIHNGLDLDRVRTRTANRDRQTIRASLRILPSEIAVVLLGTVCERKGQVDLVRALALLPQDLVSRSRFFIVGDGPTPYSSLLHATAAKLSSDRAARLAIVPATDDPYGYFQAADIAVCCSRLESYPRVILEAMAFHLPIITTPVFGIAEQVQEQVNGFFYEPDDVDQLAVCLARLISDDALRARLASNSRRVLEGLPNHEDMLEGYARLIKQATLAGETSSRRAVRGERQSTEQRRAV
jgi:glycosyltransferase involved in cell wall biosynthesis